MLWTTNASSTSVRAQKGAMMAVLLYTESRSLNLRDQRMSCAVSNNKRPLRQICNYKRKCTWLNQRKTFKVWKLWVKDGMCDMQASALSHRGRIWSLLLLVQIQVWTSAGGTHVFNKKIRIIIIITYMDHVMPLIIELHPITRNINAKTSRGEILCVWNHFVSERIYRWT